MKKIILIVFAILFLSIQSYAGFGFFKQFVIIDRGFGNEYLGNPLITFFQGQNLGAFDLQSPLILNGAEANTYNDGGDDVDYSNFYYRVYEISVDPNTVSFIQVPLGFRSVSGNDKLWDQTAEGINIVSGLNGGQTYYLEIYFDAHVNYNGGGGEIFYDSNTGLNYRATFTTNNPLPVELISFSATTIGKVVKLNWNTATEINNYGFEIERKAGSPQSSVGNYEKIGFVNGNGNSNSPKDYSFVDDNVVAGKYSYRLKQIDNNGQFEYSKVIEINLNAEKKFELNQNYPNPFNPTTKISWQSPVNSHQNLKVYDILGNEVATLINEYREAGSYSINFDASNLPSGVYIYKLQAGEFIQTRKMTLLK